jgi:hypothetical protein
MSDHTDLRLFGQPGAEHLHFDLAASYENDIEPWRDPENDDRKWVIEEWSVRPSKDHLPTVDLVLEWAGEWAAEMGELDEDGSYAFDNAAQDPAVVAAFQTALDLWASKVPHRMAGDHLRDHRVTWDDNGKPLVDGEPLYRPAEDPGSGGVR